MVHLICAHPVLLVGCQIFGTDIWEENGLFSGRVLFLLLHACGKGLSIIGGIYLFHVSFWGSEWVSSLLQFFRLPQSVLQGCLGHVVAIFHCRGYHVWICCCFGFLLCTK